MRSTKRQFKALRLQNKERKAINAFSRRLKKVLGNQLISVLLFGSKVRGDTHEDSDIDILVLISKQTIKSLSTVAKITSDVWWDYGVLLSPVTYDLEEQEKNVSMGSFFFEEMKTDGVHI